MRIQRGQASIIKLTKSMEYGNHMDVVLPHQILFLKILGNSIHLFGIGIYQIIRHNRALEIKKKQKQKKN